MYYQNYEDYMRSVLGYPIENHNTYQMNYFEDSQNSMISYQNTKELEDCYPEIYKIINPIVCEVCNKYSKSIKKDMIENIVEEVYRIIEMNNEISIKINIDNRSNPKETENIINNTKTNTIRNLNTEQLKRVSEVENRQRRPNNPFLRDLIRILILNRLLGGNYNQRPPFPRPPVRPPFPGIIEPQRPNNRDYENYF